MRLHRNAGLSVAVYTTMSQATSPSAILDPFAINQRPRSSRLTDAAPTYATYASLRPFGVRSAAESPQNARPSLIRRSP
jgi:hypothetical protein